MADPEAVARAVVDECMSVADTWDETPGDFYDVDAVRHLLSGQNGPITKQAVSKRRGLLALTTGSGQVVYPIFQLIGSDVVDGLDEVLATSLSDRFEGAWLEVSCDTGLVDRGDVARRCLLRARRSTPLDVADLACAGARARRRSA